MCEGCERVCEERVCVRVSERCERVCEGCVRGVRGLSEGCERGV